VIHLITKDNARFYSEEIKALHRARKAVFVDELGWDLAVADGMEFDEYDDELARNVVGLSVQGDVVMGLRFRPTDDRSMLLDHFAHVLPSGIRPIDDGRTWELTRGFCRERGVRRQNLRRKAACMIAPLELALAAGVDRCVGFTDVRMLTFCYSVGWKLALLGAAVPYGQGDAVAYEIEVTPSSVETMRRMWGLPERAFVHVDGSRRLRSGLQQEVAVLIEERPELHCIAPPLDEEGGSLLKQRSTTYYAAFKSTHR